MNLHLNNEPLKKGEIQKMLLREPISKDQELPRLDDIEEAFGIGEATDILHDYYKKPILRELEDWC